MATNTQSMFGNAISQLLNSWTALKLAVEHGFGGADSQEKAIWMVFAIETWFKENDGIETYEVEDFLEDILNTEFDLRVEDNSLQEISQLMCLYFRLCQENKIEELQQKLKMLPRASLQGCQMADIDNDDDVENSSYSPSTSASSASFHLTISAPSSLHSMSTGDAETMETSETSEEQLVEEDGWQVMRHRKNKK